jgi:hypothetical protein
MQHTGHFLLGTFNSEYYWRDANAELPFVTDYESDVILSSLDEMQFVFVNSPGDVLVSRYGLHPCFRQYVASLGFQFTSLPVMDEREIDPANVYASTCALLQKGNSQPFHAGWATHRVSPFSVLPPLADLVHSARNETPFPSLDTVKKVNSKSYSTRLAREAFGSAAVVIHSSEELIERGTELIARGPILIKDPLGVSGKGNLLINTPAVLSSIARHLSKQEKAGKAIEFVVEPLLPKSLDFSCQVHISRAGEVQVVSTQVMQNQGFAFSGIETAGSDLREYLAGEGYYHQVEQIAEQLYADGYFGPVCVDSMQLVHGEIVPLVEINARKSMGLINYALDQYLHRYSAQGRLVAFPLALTQPVPLEALWDRLTEADLLFTPERGYGVLPLTTRSINIVSENKPGAKKAKGRFYASIVSRDEAEGKALVQGLQHAFAQFNCQLFN